MKALAVMMFLYLGACGGALLFWLVGLGLVAVHIMTRPGLPYLFFTGAIVGVLWMLAIMTQPGSCKQA